MCTERGCQIYTMRQKAAMYNKRPKMYNKRQKKKIHTYSLFNKNDIFVTKVSQVKIHKRDLT